MKRKLLIMSLSVVCLSTVNAQYWNQLGVDMDGETMQDQSGWSVSMPDGNTVAIGAIENNGNGNNSGHVRVYTRNGSSWIQKGIDIDGNTGDSSGYSISMPSVNTIAIGSPNNSGNGLRAGRVRIYNWNGSAWIQKGSNIDGEAAGDQSGYSVSMPDTNTLAIGAISNDGNGSNSGHVRIYRWNGTTWAQKGGDIDGEFSNDQSGNSVSMPDSNMVAIGAPGNNGSGHVRVYIWNGSTWVPKGIDIDGAPLDLYFGLSVSMPDTNTIAIGAPYFLGNNVDPGNVKVYSWNGTTWVQKGVNIIGAADGDNFGWSISMTDTNTLAIGAVGVFGSGINTGYVRVYDWDGSTWTQKGGDIEGEVVGDVFGKSVSMPDTNTVGIGAPVHSGSATFDGRVRVYRFCSPSSSTSSTINPSACYSYTSPSGQVWTISNTYMDTITNAYGCDSTITINLTIDTVDTAVSVSGNTATAYVTGAIYQWIDCDNGNASINGATSRSYTTTTDGNYAVIITENNCTDTSACVHISNTTGIANDLFASNIAIYPNPSSGVFTLSMVSTREQEVTLVIYDQLGKIVYTEKMQLNEGETLRELHLETLHAGAYILKITANGRIATQPLLLID